MVFSYNHMAITYWSLEVYIVLKKHALRCIHAFNEIPQFWYTKLYNIALNIIVRFIDYVYIYL